MYLVQRGTIKPYDEYSGMFLNTVSLDHMGSAEFELGALSYSSRRIMNSYDEYSFVTCTTIKNTNNVPLVLFCKTSDKDTIISDIEDYVTHASDFPVHTTLKEYNTIPEHCGTRHLYDTNYHNDKPKYHVNDNFWWCIDKGSDYFMFFGVNDRIEYFRTLIESEYKTWWCTIPKDYKDELMAEANRGY